MSFKKVPKMALFFGKKSSKTVEKKRVLWYKYKEKKDTDFESKNGG